MIYYISSLYLLLFCSSDTISPYFDPHFAAPAVDTPIMSDVSDMEDDDGISDDQSYQGDQSRHTEESSSRGWCNIL